MFNVYNLDMTPRKLPGGVKPLDFSVPSIAKVRHTQQVEGVPGVVDYGTDWGQRDPLGLKFYLKADSSRDFRRLRRDLYNYLAEPFYVEDVNEQGIRYKAIVAVSLTPERYEGNTTTGELEVPAEMVSLPFGEDIELTETVGLAVAVEGDVPVEPYHQDLRIVITEVAGSTDHLELVNTTNGSRFKVNEGIGSGTRIEIDRVQVKINAAQALRRTDKTFITLEPGINQLELHGADSARVVTYHRNYYL